MNSRRNNTSVALLLAYRNDDHSIQLPSSASSLRSAYFWLR